MRKRLDFQPYVEALAARMRLGAWRVEILDEPPESEIALASVHPWYGRCGATIRLADNFLKGSPADQRHALVHELTHCYLAQANELSSPEMSQATERAWRLAHEYAVDQIATVIAESMPLPEEILGEEKPEQVRVENAWGTGPPFYVPREFAGLLGATPTRAAIYPAPWVKNKEGFSFETATDEKRLDVPPGVIRNTTWPDPGRGARPPRT